MQGYDIVGDVHGKARVLSELLERLGYRNEAGVFRQQGRKAIFVGDWVDRGEGIREALWIVRRMVEAGEAFAVIGNHEYNLVNYHEADSRGGFRRKHTAKNEAQVAKTNEFFDAHPGEAEDWLNWFKAQPLYLDLGFLRVIHAQWHARGLTRLGRTRSLQDVGYDRSDFMGSITERDIDLMLKGGEFTLPQGFHVRDRTGLKRNKMRVKWWMQGEGRHFPELAVLHGDRMPPVLPAQDELDVLSPYPADAPPVFIGHYGFPDFPGRLAHNVGCVDYERGGDGGIGAYRWNGERELRDEHFV